MKLEQQVTNLELSKRLKELGVKQESLFYHLSCSWGNEIKTEEQIDKENIGYSLCWSAFTVAELGEILPSGYYTMNIGRNEGMHEDCFECGHTDEKGYKRASSAKNEADARAKMLIYLLKNNLIVNPL